MTHVSRKKLSEQTEKQLIDGLKAVFRNLNPVNVDKVFSTLLTETEQVMLAKRLTAAFMLSEGASYEEIANSLHLTEQTISRIHFEMSHLQLEYKYLFSKLTPLKRKRIMKALLKEIGIKGLKIFAKYGGGRIY